MRILFIRHGDPDYVNDTLTEKGHREAVCLAEAAADLRMGDCYMSTLGRAQHTAAYSLKKIEKTHQYWTGYKSLAELTNFAVLGIYYLAIGQKHCR